MLLVYCMYLILDHIQEKLVFTFQKLLLATGASVQTEDKKVWNLVMPAARNSHPEIL